MRARGAPPWRMRGAALLLALLTVALVATLASTALWRHWRDVEVEASERVRQQASWMLVGALDWARLILREDARTGGPDHLGEVWSVPLQESRLTTFLAIDPAQAQDHAEATLSGRIVDAQARMNVRNLVADGKVSEPDREAFVRLFEFLGLEAAEVDALAEQLLRALQPVRAATAAAAEPSASASAPTPLLPRRSAQLAWLGLSPAALLLLDPYVTLLPARTPLNLNTASAEVIAASMPGLDLTDAGAIVAARARAPLRSLAAVARLLPAGTPAPVAARFSLGTRFFEVRGRLRLHDLEVEEHSLLLRSGQEVAVLWRERRLPQGVGAAEGRDRSVQ